MKGILIGILIVFALAGCVQSAEESNDAMKSEDVMQDAMVANDVMESEDVMQDAMVANDVMESEDVMQDAMIATDVMESEDVMQDAMIATDAMESDSMPHSEFQGVMLSSGTPYLEFTQSDYDKAISQGKTVMLYFYANWCPSCKTEQIQTINAFNELDRDDIIGFRVNYRDSDTDENEEQLAKDHGVTYQHTKVIIQNGERVLKAPNSWKKDTYLEELGKL